MNTSLLTLVEEYDCVCRQWETQQNASIDDLCEELVQVFEKLPGLVPEHIVDSQLSETEFSVNLRYIWPIGIRYCGRFINTIYVKKDSSLPAAKRITLAYIATEGDEPGDETYRYENDTYFGESADKYCEIEYDWKEFYALIQSLIAFFTYFDKNNGDLPYSGIATQAFKWDEHKFRPLRNKFEELNVKIYEFMAEVFENWVKFDLGNMWGKKYCLRLSNNLSVRYKGKFHNCIVMDGYNIGFGYLQYLKDGGAKYHLDPYTNRGTLTKETPYQLLHETLLDHSPEAFRETQKVLSALIEMFGEYLDPLHFSDFIDEKQLAK